MYRIILLLVIMITSFLTPLKAQKKVASNKVLNKSVNNRMDLQSKIVLSSLKNSKKRKVVNLKGTTMHRVSNADLVRRPSRSVKITPRKPITSAVNLSFHGGYYKDSLVFKPKSVTGMEPLVLVIAGGKAYDNIALFSGKLQFNVTRNKEYRMLVRTASKRDGKVIISLNDDKYYYIDLKKRENEFNIIFKSTVAGYAKLEISPLLKDFNRPYQISNLAIKSIEFMEL